MTRINERRRYKQSRCFSHMSNVFLRNCTASKCVNTINENNYAAVSFVLDDHRDGHSFVK